ncbi:MAG: hypothetical protein KAW49_07490, partial [Anaerolineae bacterium]|nr:hypothetical protein [Anaerolineae bacterium]
MAGLADQVAQAEEESVNSAHPVLKNTGGTSFPPVFFDWLATLNHVGVAKTWSRGFSRLFPP